eukprot:SAG31_NODE_29050_length_401_cov_1.337748_1_plen_87_part_10
MEQVGLRRQLLQLALLAATHVELEDLRPPEEVARDAELLKPHDPRSGPADMDDEVIPPWVRLSSPMPPPPPPSPLASRAPFATHTSC